MSIDWVFGQYKILKKIATGGMAEVFLAKRVGVKGFEKFLAIKMILPQFAENEEFISMFIDEAKLVSQLTHRNIVQIYDFGNQQSSYYIAMEYVFGKDLRSILKVSKEKGKKLPLNQCVYIITEASKGLEYAHQLKDHFGKPLNIIHRDISPQNILISYEGEVMLADFGIAKATSKSTQTQAGVLKGKILYMSPEQAWGKPLDKRSDIYSLGVVLYEMISDRKIFEADSEMSMLEKVREARIEYPPEIFREIPKPLVSILKKALEKDPKDRYQSAHEMRVDLEKYLISTKETMNEKKISDYLKQLFEEEIEEEKKVFIEETKIPIEKPYPPEDRRKTEIQIQGDRGPVSVEMEGVGGIKEKGIFNSFRKVVREGHLGIKLGTLVILFAAGIILVVYLTSQKISPPPLPPEVGKKFVEPSVPIPFEGIKVNTSQGKPSEKPSEKPSAKPEEKKPYPSEMTKSPPAEKERSQEATEKPKEAKALTHVETTLLSHILSQGATLLINNQYSTLLEDIHKLPERDRGHNHIRILECFAHLKRWVLLRDKNSKILWGNLYKAIEQSGDKSATPLLLNITKDPEEWTRLYAVALLGIIGDQRALNELHSIAVSDPNWRIRKNARESISMIQKRNYK